MTSEQPYPSSAAVDTAIKDAARNARKRDPSRNVSNMIRQACFDRFLCRVFSDGANSEWVLKGGTGMLARIPSTRATLDVDLYHNGFTLDQALEDLKRLVAVDLGDHFRFVYDSHVSAVEGQAQPYTDGYRVTFIPYLGARELPSFHVDLAIGAGVTAPIETTAPRAFTWSQGREIVLDSFSDLGGDFADPEKLSSTISRPWFQVKARGAVVSMGALRSQ